MTNCKQRRAQAGFTYLAALVAVFVVGAAFASLAEPWSHARQREKEAELMWVGEQFRNAIGLYYERTPGAVKRFPEKLEDLLDDGRYLAKQRYLRRIYIDPMTGMADWGVITASGGGIAGVHSRAQGKPLKSGGFRGSAGAFANATSYRHWRFVYSPPAPPASGTVRTPR